MSLINSNLLFLAHSGRYPIKSKLRCFIKRCTVLWGWECTWAAWTRLSAPRRQVYASRMPSCAASGTPIPSLLWRSEMPVATWYHFHHKSCLTAMALGPLLSRNYKNPSGVPSTVLMPWPHAGTLGPMSAACCTLSLDQKTLKDTAKLMLVWAPIYLLTLATVGQGKHKGKVELLSVNSGNENYAWSGASLLSSRLNKEVSPPWDLKTNSFFGFKDPLHTQPMSPLSLTCHWPLSP